MLQPRKLTSANVSGTGLTKTPGPLTRLMAARQSRMVRESRLLGGARAVMEPDDAAALERAAIRLQFERHHRHNGSAKAVSPCCSPNFQMLDGVPGLR